MPRELQIVLDENLPWSLASELKSRGYLATSNYALNASGLADPEWLEIVAALSPPAILVTFDSAMPIEHEAWLRELGVTLAVVDSRNRPADLTPEQYWRDVISTATRTSSLLKSADRGGSIGGIPAADSTRGKTAKSEVHAMPATRKAPTNTGLASFARAS